MYSLVWKKPLWPMQQHKLVKQLLVIASSNRLSLFHLIRIDNLTVATMTRRVTRNHHASLLLYIFWRYMHTKNNHHQGKTQSAVWQICTTRASVLHGTHVEWMCRSVGAKSTVSSLSKRQREREITSQRAQERQGWTCGLYFKTQKKTVSNYDEFVHIWQTEQTF